MLLKPPIGAQLDRSHSFADDLVGAWLLNERGGIIAHDMSGHGNDCTGSVGWDAKGAVLDGTNDYLVGVWPQNAGLLTSGTITFTVRRNFAANVVKYIFDSEGSTRYLLWHRATGAWQLYLSGNGIANVPEDWIPNGETTTCAISFDDARSSDKQIYYKNGIQYYTTDTAHGGGLASILHIGQRFSYEGRWLGGIHSFGIYNRALTPNEIQDLYIDPYAAFRAPARRIWVPTGAAATYIPAMMHHYHNTRVA